MLKVVIIFIHFRTFSGFHVELGGCFYNGEAANSSQKHSSTAVFLVKLTAHPRFHNAEIHPEM